MVRFSKAAMLLLLSVSTSANLFMSGVAHSAAKPITGVSCGGGFYIRTRDGHLHWVRPGAEREVQEVYSGGRSLHAMTECGTGVVSVFEDRGVYTAYYSSNCLNVGTASGDTEKVYEGKQAITAFAQDGSALITTVSSGARWRSESCLRIAEPPSKLLE